MSAGSTTPWSSCWTRPPGSGSSFRHTGTWCSWRPTRRPWSIACRRGCRWSWTSGWTVRSGDRPLTVRTARPATAQGTRPSTVVAVKARGALALILALILCGCGAASGPATAPSSSFYQDPGASAAPPGTMLRVQPLGTDVPGARADRILYQSSTSTGVAALSGGMVFVPVGRAPATGRPIVAWAHPVIGDDFAPSRSTSPLSGMQPWLTEMIARGWIVVATDFVGVGTGHQEWLNGRAEAHDVTYSVEAVHHLGGADAGRRWVT